MAALTAAVVSPIDGLGEDYLFSMHMLQHILLGDLAPVLLLLALSRVIMRPATRRLLPILAQVVNPWATAPLLLVATSWALWRSWSVERDLISVTPVNCRIREGAR